MDSRIAPPAEILRLNTTLFRNCLDGLSDEQAAARLTPADLDGPSGAKFPLFNGTVLATLTFLVQHDSYHLGQPSLLRKYCGLPACVSSSAGIGWESI